MESEESEEKPSDGAKAPPLQQAREKAQVMKRKVAENVGPVAEAALGGVRAGLHKVGDALRVDEPHSLSPELLSQADLPEVLTEDALASLAKRLDREADFWRGVAMRQLARVAWTERLGVTSSLLLLVGGVVLGAIAAFRALFATEGGSSTAMLIGVGVGVLVTAAVVVNRLLRGLRQGQIDSVKEALRRADLSEMRLHRIAFLMELRQVGEGGYVAALTGLEADVRNA